MKAEFTAIIDAAPESGYWAICPEGLGANGQGETISLIVYLIRVFNCLCPWFPK